MEFDQSLYNSRRRTNRIGLTLSMLAMALGLAVLLWILAVLFGNGIAALDLNMFLHDTPAQARKAVACATPSSAAR